MSFNSFGGIVEEQVRRDKNIIYGARSLRKQLGYLSLARATFDYDVYSKKPQLSARKLERNLDKNTGKDRHYVKPAAHPGTFKVVNVGYDNRRGTKDDYGVADFTKPTVKIPYKVINKIRYSTLAHEVSNRKKSLADKNFSFRHAKDKYDLGLIRLKRRWGKKYGR